MPPRRSHDAPKRLRLLGLSVQALCESTGIARSKLYDAFDDDAARERLKKRLEPAVFALLFPRDAA